MSLVAKEVRCKVNGSSKNLTTIEKRVMALWLAVNLHQPHLTPPHPTLLPRPGLGTRRCRWSPVHNVAQPTRHRPPCHHCYQWQLGFHRASPFPSQFCGCPPHRPLNPYQTSALPTISVLPFLLSSILGGQLLDSVKSATLNSFKI